MKKTFLQSSKQIPAWQAERAALLQRACNSVETRVKNGNRKGKAIRRVSKYLNGRSFRCEPKRHLRLLGKTLRRVHDVWKRNGETPSAFRLNYRARVPAIPVLVLVRFANFCASIQQRSLKSAWNNFARREQSAGRSLKFTYYQVRYEFLAANFYLIQDDLKAVQASQTKLAQQRLRVIADIRSRLDRSPRRRVN
jgi:hypothetical protein